MYFSIKTILLAFPVIIPDGQDRSQRLLRRAQTSGTGFPPSQVDGRATIRFPRNEHIW